MLADIVSVLTSSLGIFSFSFVVALSGAMAPGPLLTYTIFKSVGSGPRGYLMGLWVIIGHALLEIGVIIMLLLGFSSVIAHPLARRGIGLVGGTLLVIFGVVIVRDVLAGKISTAFLDPDSTEAQAGDPSGPVAIKGIDNPVIGGVLVSMSNPYWWVWWATAGLAFMVKFEVSLTHWPNLISFFLGHEAGDLIWYLLVSCLAFFGIRRLNKRVYFAILIACGIFMVLFGGYLGASPFWQSSV